MSDTTAVGRSGTEPAAGARRWAAATIGLTLGAFAIAVALRPAAGTDAGPAPVVLVFIGSSMHVASTAWFSTVPEVRHHARRHLQRYAIVPMALIAASAIAAAALSEAAFAWLLLAFFAWQFFHFQKQNLGLTALASTSSRIPSLTRAERTAIVACGCAGIAGLLLRPALLDLDLDLGPAVGAAGVRDAVTVAYAASALGSVIVLLRRPRQDRSIPFTILYLVSILFFVPVFVFDEPFAAVGGIVLAHGSQYLLLVGLVAGGTPDLTGRVVALAAFVNIALVGGLALAVASHLHAGEPATRAVYGAFVGVVMAHFVIDAGLWRLRDRFPRELLGERLPALLPRR